MCWCRMARLKWDPACLRHVYRQMPLALMLMGMRQSMAKVHSTLQWRRHARDRSPIWTDNMWSSNRRYMLTVARSVYLPGRLRRWVRSARWAFNSCKFLQLLRRPWVR